VPRAIDRAWFAQLSLSNFMTSVFRSLFQAVAAAGGLPSDDTPQGLWIHNLTKAGGPLLEQVINELAVMPLPLPPNPRDSSSSAANSSAQNGQNMQNGQAAPVQLRAPSPAEQRYASELLARLLDMGFMRRIGAAKRKMSQLPDGKEKITLLGDITTMETARKDLQTQVYGNVA
jgi:DNA primase